MSLYGHASSRVQTPNITSHPHSNDFLRELQNRTAGRGELRLVLAILEDAVRRLQRRRVPERILPRLFRIEAEEWFKSRERRPLFSFENLCSLLGLDPEEVRGHVFDRPGTEGEVVIELGAKRRCACDVAHSV